MLGKLPQRGDGLLTLTVKGLSIYEDLLKHMGVQDGASIQTAIQRLGGTEEHDNPHFVQLFFTAGLREGFRIVRLPVQDHVEIVLARSTRYGTLFFIEWRWGTTPDYSSQFWSTEGFDFRGLLDRLWARFEGAIHVDFQEDSHRGLRACYSPVCWLDFELTTASAQRFEAFMAQAQVYRRDKVARTYLLQGAPGTGKTTFVLRAMRVLGGRVLRLGAAGLTQMRANELDFLLDHLDPACFMVDDVDKVDLKEALPKLLTVLSEFKARRPELVTFLTANQKTFDAALVRPGRIDEIVDFQPPGKEERYELLRRLAPGVVSDSTVAYFAKLAEGLTAPYLEEVALQLRYRSPYEVSSLVWQMRERVGEVPPKTEKKEPGAAEEKPG